MSLRINKLKMFFAVALTVALVGCSKPNESGASAGHAHAAPHGGALVMLGQHAAQLELVPENGGKTWALYVLDGGAQRFVRVEQESVSATLDGRSVVFQAIENPATGEIAGNTSKFGLEADWLDPNGSFSVEIDEIVIFGQAFLGIEFPFPEGKH